MSGGQGDRVPHPREIQGLPRRPAPGGGRDGRHPRRHPGPGLVLAGEHHRHRPDPPGPRRPQAVDAVRVVWVADRGFTSQKNRRALMRGGGGYIIGEKLRSGSAEVKAALSRQGRYATVKDNMQVKEVSIGTDDRFVLCFNPAQAERDAAHPREARRAARRSHRRHRHAHRGRARPDRRHPVGQAGAQAVPAHDARRAAAHRQAEDQDRGEPGRQVPAALLGPQSLS